MRKKGFTLVEILVAIVLASIILIAVVGLYIASDRSFKKTKPVSDVLEEMRSGIATLDFVFSRWGAGVPCYNNTCTIGSTIPACSGYPPTDPMCMTCNDGDLANGCSDIEFYANLYGLGFAVSATTSFANIISCRLSTTDNQNCYYIWQGGKVVNYNSTATLPPAYGFNVNFDSIDCINFSGSPNLTIDNPIMCQWINGTLDCDNNNTYSLQAGDVIIRVPHKVEFYVAQDTDGSYWLMMDKTDMESGCNSNETALKVARIKDANSFKVYAIGRSVKVVITFATQGPKEQTLTIERYFGR
ncbi:MAG: prepilin-type N-terminal cleavage/methylation domain-containing protein [Spirochaetaceae bacterium]|nr:prepilin-type N-terminal cleavage/methylation domain-containing protein [Spirochaetaceae bacterium]